MRRWLGVVGLALAVAFLPQSAWADTTTPTDSGTTTATSSPTDTATATPTDTATPTVTQTVTAPPSVQTVQLSDDQFTWFVVGGSLLGALAAGSFVLGMRR